jgi:hypothetical protein
MVAGVSRHRIVQWPVPHYFVSKKFTGDQRRVGA